MNLRHLYSTIGSIGAAIGACSCIAMIAATIAGLAGVIGLPLVFFLPDPVNSLLQATAQSLLILSLILIVFSAMHSTTRIPFVLSLIGTPPTYAGMFLIPGGMSTTGLHTVHSVNAVALVTFWAGVSIIVAALVIARRDREIPLYPMKRFAQLVARRLVLAAISVSVLVYVPTLSFTGISGVAPTQPAATEQPIAVKIEANNFLWKGTLTNYSKEENYFLSFSGGKAKVTIKHTITSGKFTLGIMDGMGTWVLRERVVLSVDPQTIELTTESGMSGKWMIILSFNSVNGTIEVNIKPV